jgi:hypothetical protein
MDDQNKKNIFNPYNKEISEAIARLRNAIDKTDYQTIRNELGILRGIYIETSASYFKFTRGLEEILNKKEISPDIRSMTEFLLTDAKKEYEEIKRGVHMIIMLQNDYRVIDSEKRNRIYLIEKFIADSIN